MLSVSPFALLFAGLVLAGTGLCGGSGQTQPAHFIQDRFVIGFWVGPPLDEKAEERYREIAEAHFTLVVGGFGARTPEQVRRQLELCEQFDLRAIVEQAGVAPEDLPDRPACWGYRLADEPHPSAYPELRERLEAIRRARPGKLSYINLFPNYVPLGAVEAESYDDYVARFLREVPVAVLSIDHYPIFKPDGDGRDNYCANLEMMRRQSLEKGIPFWNFFNAMPYGPHTDPTEAQLRWQVFTALAYGAKGVLYFCYYTPAGDEFPKGGALIARDDRRTHHWYQARRLNAQLKALGPTLMQLTSTGVYRVKPGDDPSGVLTGTPLRNVVRADVDPPLDLLVGGLPPCRRPPWSIAQQLPFCLHRLAHGGVRRVAGADRGGRSLVGSGDPGARRQPRHAGSADRVGGRRRQTVPAAGVILTNDIEKGNAPSLPGALLLSETGA